MTPFTRDQTPGTKRDSATQRVFDQILKALGLKRDAADPNRVILTAQTLQPADVNLFVSAAGGALQVTLPKAALVAHDLFIIKIDASANAVNYIATPGETVNGGAGGTLAAQYNKVTLVSDRVNGYYTK